MANRTKAHSLHFGLDHHINHGDQNRDLLRLRLSQVGFLEPLSSEGIEWLSLRLPTVQLDPGQIFYTPGCEAPSIFLLLEGRMRLYDVVETHELTLNIIAAGSVFGEASLAECPQQSYAAALEPSTLGVLGLDIFHRLIEENPLVGLRAIQLLAERLCHQEAKMTDIGLKEVPIRLANLILRLLDSEGVVIGEGRYKIPSRYTHQQLAAMIAAKRVAVTRAFATLRGHGAVRLKRRHIYIDNVNALKRIARMA